MPESQRTKSSRENRNPYLEILEQAIYFDLEHYIYHKPICIGIFGAGVVKPAGFEVTQYFLESKSDLKGLVRTARDYLLEQQRSGKKTLVTFAGNNDLGVLKAMLARFHLSDDFLDEFHHLDLQREMKKQFGVMFSLAKTEALVGICRQNVEVSGSTLAKTFAAIMKKPDYIHRMPKEKIHRFLSYNEADVVNLYGILKNWSKIQPKNVKAQMALDEKMRQEKRALREAQRMEQEKTKED